MDPIDFLTNKELIRFFHCKKTEMSCMEQPNTFLNQLRDHDLVPEELYEKVIKIRCKEKKKDGVYKVLDRLEKDKSENVRLFWKCVLQDHILQKYQVLRVLSKSLMDGTFQFYEKHDVEEEKKDSPPSEGNTSTGKRRGRKRKKSVEETEEEEQPGPSSSFSTPSAKKTPKKPVFSSPVKRGENQNIWTRPLFKTHLPVTCGDKEGTLSRDKLAKGHACILSQGRWFTPSGFEQFSGKGSYKNWKLSIHCQSTPLKILIKDGHLKCSRMKRTSVPKRRRQQSPLSSSGSSSPASSVESKELIILEEQRGGQEEEEDDEEEEEWEDEEERGDQEMMDLAEFQAPFLQVSCGSITGVLYKSRFASGRRSKSIRTEEGWLTPEEFVKHLPDGNWKRDIQCHGKMLNSLLEKILRVHSLLCNCNLCSPTQDQQLDQNNDDECFICNSEGDLVCCDKCPRAFHYDCHIPALQDNTLGERWMCTYCVFENCPWRHGNMTEEQALNGLISQYTLHCEYLLLHIYKEDTESVFSKDPSTEVPTYRNFIRQPMWLDRVKKKLHNQQYKTLGHFVSDIRLIFRNCLTFNTSNQSILKMGATLSQMFEQRFKTILGIQ